MRKLLLPLVPVPVKQFYAQCLAFTQRPKVLKTYYQFMAVVLTVALAGLVAAMFHSFFAPFFK